MKRRITRAEARAFKARWQLVNDAEIEELRNTPPEVKLRQLAALMAFAKSLGWDRALEEEVAAVRERWCRLRTIYLARGRTEDLGLRLPHKK